MEQTNNPDELIEIKPDEEVIHEDDFDMTISEGSVPAGNAVPDTEAEEDTVAAAAAVTEPDTIEETDVSASGEDTENEASKEQNVTGEATTDTEAGEDAGFEAIDAGAGALATDFEDDFSAELEEMEREEADMEMVEQIGDSIVMQVDAELENSIISIPIETDALKEDAEPEDDEDDAPKGFFARIPWWAYMVAGVALVILTTVIWIVASSSGHSMAIKWGSKYAAEQVTYQPVEPVATIDVPDETDDKTEDIDYKDIEVIDDDHSVITPELSPVPTPDITGDEEIPEVIPEEQGVYNILLIGEENIDSGGYRGRSDLIMLATINAKQKKVKLTSVMRDCLVSIPGHVDNRINAAYAIGGVSLLYDTLYQNLGVEIDNYMLVDFEGFETIIDAIGGVDIELTAAEAKYLNTTNYISDKSNRTIVKGLNHLNGNQALGYCRIRNVGTADNQYSDFGRTSRQRNVLNSIYTSSSELNYFGLVNLASKCLPYVTTDLTADDIEKYITLLLEIGIPNGIENFRIPIGGTYSEVLLRDMIVTKIDLQKNSEELRNFIYGKENAE